MTGSIKTLSNLVHDDRGSIGPMFGLLMLPAVMFIGGAIDFGNAYKAKQKLQAASDAAVLAALSVQSTNNGANRQNVALGVFDANMAGVSGVSRSAVVNGDIVNMTASMAVDTAFLKLASINTINVSGNSTGQAVTNTTTTTTTTTTSGAVCLLALDPGSSVTGFKSQGTPNVNYENCWAHTNSTSATAIDGGGSAVVTGAGHSAVGTVTSAAMSVYSPAPVGGQTAVADPFATVGAYVTPYSSYTPTFTPPNIANTCTASNLNLKKGTFTLEPGRYCGGINLQAQASVTLNPGEYIIDNGEFNVQSGASVTGENVLLYFSGAQARFTVIGGGTVNLKGRTSGSSDLKGFLFIAHPDAWRGLTSNIQGGGTFNMEGVIYAPTQNIEITGNGDANASSNFFSIVAKSFEFRGNGIFRYKPWSSASTLNNIQPTKQVPTTTVVTTTTTSGKVTN